jgi:subtilisin family serine protease
MDYGRPMAINVSIGNNYGSHDGTSLLSTYIDTVASMSRLSISVGTGNEGFSSTHTSGILSNTQDRERAQTVEFNVGAYERSFNIQLWKSYVDSFNIALKSPSGASTGVISNVAGIGEYLFENTRIYVYYGEPSPYSQYQEIYLEFIPVDNYIQAGTWQIDLSPVRIVDGRYDMWLPVESTSKDTAFLEPTPDTTLTVPSTSSAVVSVGAYDAYTDGYADFSGRGYTRVIGQVKPDIVAPGVNIVAAEANYSLGNNNYVERTGTSFATPFATGSAALMMEWGIVKGNDMYMYGEKIKAYLQKGARQLAGFKEYPNPQVGYGALCLRDSIAGR